MTWLRMTDTFATHPTVLAVLEHPDADERSVDEVAGYMARLATQAAQHFTDYVVSFATAATLAGSRARAEQLLTQADFAGYGVLEVDDETGRRRFRLVDDPEFLHMITAEQYAWQQQQKADNSNTAITVPVRCRDGDVCRYCRNVVNFRAKRGQLRGTYDHRPPGQPGSAETSVVACGSCNARRGNQPVAVADLALPLLPAPDQEAVYFHRATREWLQGYAQILRQHGMVPPPPAPDQKDLTAGRPVAGAKAALTGRRATDGPTKAAPTRQQPPASADPTRSAAPATSPAELLADPGKSQQERGLPLLEAPGRVGTGRDGSPEVSTSPGDSSSQPRPARPETWKPPKSAPPPSDPPAPPTPASPRKRARGRRGGSRSRTRTQGDSR
jgi:hypothetical protein